MSERTERRKFHTLDGIRGVAALLVVSRHIGPMGFWLPESFLAVDLFFLLSGFVVAYSYDQRLAAGDYLARFAVTRLIRLYPLYILGTVLGFVPLLTGAKTIGHSLLALAVAGLLMLPRLPRIHVACGDLDNPTWTLSLELAANLFYAAFFAG